MKRNESAGKYTNLFLPFVSDSLSRNINSLISTFDLSAKLINTSSKTLKDVFKKKKSQEHDDCAVCDTLPTKYSCNVSNIVYEFVCQYCGANYIGKTSRTFRTHYSEHLRGIKNKMRRVL